MSNFQQQSNAPPTEDEWIRREEDLERSEERRSRRLEQAVEYGFEVDNYAELPEFTGKPARIERMQGSLDFGEVA